MKRLEENICQQRDQQEPNSQNIQTRLFEVFGIFVQIVKLFVLAL